MRRVAITLLIGLLISLCCFAQSTTTPPPPPLSASINFSGNTSQQGANEASAKQAVIAAIISTPKYQESLQSLHVLFNKYISKCTANTSYSTPNFISQNGSTTYFIKGRQNKNCQVQVSINVNSLSGSTLFTTTQLCAYTPDSVQFLTSGNVQNTYSVEAVSAFLEGLNQINKAECRKQ